MCGIFKFFIIQITAYNQSLENSGINKNGALSSDKDKMNLKIKLSAPRSDIIKVQRAPEHTCNTRPTSSLSFQMKLYYALIWFPKMYTPLIQSERLSWLTNHAMAQAALAFGLDTCNCKSVLTLIIIIKGLHITGEISAHTGGWRQTFSLRIAPIPKINLYSPQEK